MSDPPPDPAASQRGGSRKFLWLAAILAVIAVVLAGLLGISLVNGGSFSARPAPQDVTITGIDRQIRYIGNTTDSIGPATNDACAECPIVMRAGSTLSLTILSFDVHAPVPEVYLWLWVNSSIPLTFSQGTFFGFVNGETNVGVPVLLDPPSGATGAVDGALLVTGILAPCSYNSTAWDYCY